MFNTFTVRWRHRGRFFSRFTSFCPCFHCHCDANAWQVKSTANSVGRRSAISLARFLKISLLIKLMDGIRKILAFNSTDSRRAFLMDVSVRSVRCKNPKLWSVYCPLVAYRYKYWFNSIQVQGNTQFEPKNSKQFVHFSISFLRCFTSLHVFLIHLVSLKPKTIQSTTLCEKNK